MSADKPAVDEAVGSEGPLLRATVILGRPEPTEPQAAILEELLAARPGWVLETVDDDWPPDALAETALEAGAELLVAAGGDGTVAALAGVLARAGAEAPPLAILPFGTANDFARTLAVTDVDAALEALERADEHAIDLIRVRSEESDEERFVLNVANGGLAWDIGSALDGEQKNRWGVLAYARGALDVIGAPVVHRVAIQVDEEPVQRGEALTIAVSSGRTCGGGLRLAPTADPEDGLLEVTLLRDESPGSVIALAARMRASAVLEHPALERFRGRSVAIETDPPMRFVLDGELAPGHPTAFTVAPGAVRMWVGEDYRREPPLER